MIVRVHLTHTIKVSGIYEMNVTEEEYADTSKLIDVVKSGEYISMQPSSGYSDKWDVLHITNDDFTKCRKA